MSAWQRQKNWWNEVLWKPKKPLSLDQLKFQYQVLLKNPVVTDNNKQLLVETFRSIAEILIWGDQNDSKVFDFFLEKNMQTFFLKILTQKCGHYVCIQLLQTLNILFENIRDDTSIYYLLSNNHINSIIVLKLDFSDEEVLAYYISFLKTLSFHLNKHTIHFFYNEHLRDFPLYTEAIKFFKHSESMVRIAVRTLTLNVYKVVNDETTLNYICNKTAAPYFSNLVWFIGNHVIELDECLISQAHHLNRGRLEQLVAQHLDHLHYIADIFSLDIDCLNDTLSDHFLNRLLIPLYINSLVDKNPEEGDEKSPRISSGVALFLLSQVFLILPHPSVITPLTYLIFTGDMTLELPPILQQGHKRGNSYNTICAFIQPETSLETSLVRHSSQVHANPITMQPNSTTSDNKASYASQSSIEGYVDSIVDDQYVVIEASPSNSGSSHSSQGTSSTLSSPSKSKRKHLSRQVSSPSSNRAHAHAHSTHHGIPIVNPQFLNSLMGSLAIYNDDSRCLFAISILYAMLKNEGNHHKLLEAFSLRPKPLQEEGSPQYNSELVALLLSILDSCTSTSNCIRLVTLRLAIMLLMELLGGVREGERDLNSSFEGSKSPMLTDHHIALIANIYESAVLKLRLHYKGPNDEIFLDLFESEYENEKAFKLNVSYLMMDETMLLPPSDTPLNGVDFTRRLPCGETERARKTMRVFFAIRDLSQQMSGLEEDELPLTMATNSAKEGDVLDISNRDLISCEVTVGDKTTQHFMVFFETEFLLVDPHKSIPGNGVVHFIAFLQEVDVAGDPADGHALFILVCQRNSTKKRPSLSGRFLFDDHIRCSAAKSCFQRSRDLIHHSKMVCVSRMLHLPVPDSPSSSSLSTSITSSTTTTQHRQLMSFTPPILSSSDFSTLASTPLTTTAISTPNYSSLHTPISPSFLQGFIPPPLSGEEEEGNSEQMEMSAVNISGDGVQSYNLGEVQPEENPTVHLSLPLTYSALLELDKGRIENDYAHDMSPTPEPGGVDSDYQCSLDNEEMLTVNGGLSWYNRAQLAQEEGHLSSEHAQKEGELSGEHAQKEGELSSEHAQKEGELSSEPAQEEQLSSEHAQKEGELSSEHAQKEGELSGEHAQKEGELSSEHAQKEGELSGEHAQKEGELSAQKEGELSSEPAQEEQLSSEHAQMEGELSNEPAQKEEQLSSEHAQKEGELSSEPAQEEDQLSSEPAQEEEPSCDHAQEEQQSSEHAQEEPEQFSEHAHEEDQREELSGEQESSERAQKEEQDAQKIGEQTHKVTTNDDSTHNSDIGDTSAPNHWVGPTESSCDIDTYNQRASPTRELGCTSTKLLTQELSESEPDHNLLVEPVSDSSSAPSPAESSAAGVDGADVGEAKRSLQDHNLKVSESALSIKTEHATLVEDQVDVPSVEVIASSDSIEREVVPSIRSTLLVECSQLDVNDEGTAFDIEAKVEDEEES